MKKLLCKDTLPLNLVLAFCSIWVKVDNRTTFKPDSGSKTLLRKETLVLSISLVCYMKMVEAYGKILPQLRSGMVRHVAMAIKKAVMPMRV